MFLADNPVIRISLMQRINNDLFAFLIDVADVIVLRFFLNRELIKPFVGSHHYVRSFARGAQGNSGHWFHK